jgi:hypothetical protein
MGGRCTITVDREQPITLRNLPDTGSFDDLRWSNVATLTLTAGRHPLRWTNVDGGGVNLDALAFCNDQQWDPVGKAENPPAPGRHMFIVQAETFSNGKGKEMVVTEEEGGNEPDQFQFRPGQIKRYPRSPNPEICIFPAWGWVSSILYVTQIDYARSTIHVERNRSASQDIRAGNRYYVANVLEELDQPGEPEPVEAADGLEVIDAQLRGDAGGGRGPVDESEDLPIGGFDGD